MMIYERPNCAVPNCTEKAFCIYSGVWVCGKCLEKIHKKDQSNKLKILMEITE